MPGLSVVVLGGSVKTMPVFRNANLSGVRMIADLPGADLAGADFSRAMVGVNIKNQGMGQMRTDLSNANMAGARLEGAGGRFSTVRLRDGTALDCAALFFTTGPEPVSRMPTSIVH